MLFTKVTLNGQKALLLIDTGASKSILDINRANEFGFKVNMTLDTTRRYIGIGGLTEIYKVYDYKIDGYSVSFLGSDLSYVNEYLYKNYIPIAGVLGGDFFIKKRAVIDYKKKMIFIK